MRGIKPRSATRTRRGVTLLECLPRALDPPSSPYPPRKSASEPDIWDVLSSVDGGPGYLTEGALGARRAVGFGRDQQARPEVCGRDVRQSPPFDARGQVVAGHQDGRDIDPVRTPARAWRPGHAQN